MPPGPDPGDTRFDPARRMLKEARRNMRTTLLWSVIPLTAALSMAGAPTPAEAKGEASLLLGRTFVSALRLHDKTSFGGTIGVFSRIVGFELGIDAMPTSRLDVAGVDLGASVLDVTGNVVLQLPLGELVPYGTVGYGALIANASGSLEGDRFLGTFGAFNYGLGAKMFFTDHVGLRLDYRRFAIQTDKDNPDLEIPIVGGRINTEPDIDRFLVGVAFRW
jgi:opacity protein-like surface antigen